jgi:L-serine dehydratase
LDTIEKQRKLINKNQTRLRKIISSSTEHDKVIQLLINHHASLHSAKISQKDSWSFEDAELNDISEDLFRRIPLNNEHSIAWCIWHLARIEDIAMNYLIADRPQVFTLGNWQERMMVKNHDSGNEMDLEETKLLSDHIDLRALREYRVSVGLRTREIVKQITAEMLNELVHPSRIQQIKDDGAVSPAAYGITEYWGRRNIAGLLLMPATRYPSIFNDVIGPIMRGPSSSHCAAAVRIGRIARDLMDGELDNVLIEFDPKGSLATTHQSQGSDIGIFGGFLGWEATDERLVQSPTAIEKAGIKIDIQIIEYGADHPNTYRLKLTNKRDHHEMTAISTGGGMIEVTEIDGIQVSIFGDYYETLIFINTDHDKIFNYLNDNVDADEINIREGSTSSFIEIKAQSFLSAKSITFLANRFDITNIKEISPVLPILDRKSIQIPFITCAEMLQYNKNKGLDLWELAIEYESSRGNISKEQVLQKMESIVDIIRKSIRTGLSGTEYEDRILHYQSGTFQEKMETHALLETGMLNRMILYTTALMETKSSMGVIVAAPTAGACGGLPGACFGAADSLELSKDEIIKSMLAAGLIGVFIAAGATFAAEVGGCQAECGAGSGMAAAGLVTLANGSVQQAVSAVSMALQNILGMICDPVANRVEVPCLGKNILAASNALSCANIALANYDPVIPLDEVIDTMEKVGVSIPVELRCTALGGLSVTKTSKEIEYKLNK